MILNIPMDHLILVPLNTTGTGIKQLYQKGKILEKELIECNNPCTNKSGKIKPGKGLEVKYSSSVLSKTVQLKSDLKECFTFLNEKYDTCSSLFNLQFRKAESVIRKKKQNKRKAKSQSLTVTSQTKKEF